MFWCSTEDGSLTTALFSTTFIIFLFFFTCPPSCSLECPSLLLTAFYSALLSLFTVTTTALVLLKTVCFPLGFFARKDKSFSYPEFPSAAPGSGSGARSPAAGKFGAAGFSAPLCQPPQSGVSPSPAGTRSPAGILPIFGSVWGFLRRQNKPVQAAVILC